MSVCPFSDPARIWTDLSDARATPGLVWSEPIGRWIVSRYDDIVAALHDPATFCSEPTVPPLPDAVAPLFEGRVPARGTLLGHDNPTHDRLRAAVNTFFMPRRIARYESWIEAQAHALIDEFYEEGELDLRARFSSPLPLKAISHIVGLDPDRSQENQRKLDLITRPSVGNAEPILSFHAEVEAAIAARRTDRRDDLISHVWNMRDSGEAVMTDFEMLSLFPGLMLAGHETSSNLLVMALAHLLSRPGAYEAAQQSDATRMQALEEAFRFEGPITGMPRRVTRPVRLGGTDLRPGDEVFLAYASGNRDRARFPDGDTFDVERRSAAQHIAFGQGIHACLGAPLARLLLKVELRVIAERLPGLRFAIPYEDRDYFPFREVRALVKAPFAWDVLDRHRAKLGRHALPATVAAEDGWLAARVVARRAMAEGVVELQLQGRDGPLPAWTPGSHAEIELPGGLVRHYSLCGLAGASDWTIAVRREADGRGGSRQIHDMLAEGDKVRVRPPRNHFSLPTENRPVLMIAGGIGITPFLPMAETLATTGADWRIVYLGRSERTMAYRDRLSTLDPARVTIRSGEAPGRFDLEELLAAVPLDTVVYCCGPERLIAAVDGLGDGLGLEVRTERFAPMDIDTSADRPFGVVIASSGKHIEVAASETVLHALAREGITILSTCQEGTCGSCEVAVIAGQVVHRDTVLTREERAANESMMICVSRCMGDRLVLGL